MTSLHPSVSCCWLVSRTSQVKCWLQWFRGKGIVVYIWTHKWSECLEWVITVCSEVWCQEHFWDAQILFYCSYIIITTPFLPELLYQCLTCPGFCQLFTIFQTELSTLLRLLICASLRRIWFSHISEQWIIIGCHCAVCHDANKVAAGQCSPVSPKAHWGEAMCQLCETEECRADTFD